MEVSEGRKYFHEKKTKQELKRGENNKIKQTNEEPGRHKKPNQRS